MIEPAPQRRAGTTRVTNSQPVAERVGDSESFQDARIRALLVSMEALNETCDSSILHCSSRRLREIWHRVRVVNALVSNRLAPLLEEHSAVPELEKACANSRKSLEMLTDSRLPPFDGFVALVPSGNRTEVRQAVRTSAGQLRAFLHETFIEIVDADPRCEHDKDYFLSNRFPRDIKRSRKLFRDLKGLEEYLIPILRESCVVLPALVRDLLLEARLPSAESWAEVEEFRELMNDAVAKLTKLTSRENVRAEECDILVGYGRRIDSLNQRLKESYLTAHEAIEAIAAADPPAPALRDQWVADLAACGTLPRQRIANLARELHKAIYDLHRFVSNWRRTIAKRRALAFSATANARGLRRWSSAS